jgi:hypothetical protein
MKQTSTSHRNIKAFVLSMSIGLIAAQVSFANKVPAKKITLSGEEGPAKKVKAKNRSSHTNTAIKIYPDAIRRMMHVVAKAANRGEIDFFVFDMEGTLMRNYKMKAKDHLRIEGLKKGTYIYRVFSGDEETASGNFEIK